VPNSFVTSILSAVSRKLVWLLCSLALLRPLLAQRDLAGAAEMKLYLDRMTVTGSVLMIAAHPDDENTALLAYLARGRKVRTGYLSLTRGEGGQNLIGSDQGDELGVIRTQELLAARRIDGAEQFFTRAIDFGFTKTPQETFEKWGREKILADVVWVIRRFQPEVIILRFSGTPRDGHGQHQASAILGKEAYSAAADPAKFPEQLQWVKPWQAKRLMWNAFSFNRQQETENEKLTNKVECDPGDYNPVLGYSYGEIAGMSRSMHRSQGMGAPERKGSQKNVLVTVAGDPATKDIFDGVDLTWDSVPGAAEASRLLSEAARTFDMLHPEKSVPLLLKAEPLLAGISNPIAERKHRELLDTIALCSGLWLDATSDRSAVTPGKSLVFTAQVLNREAAAAQIESVWVDGVVKASGTKVPTGQLPKNTAVNVKIDVPIPAGETYSAPYWLREPKSGSTYTVSNQTDIGMAQNPPLFQMHFRVRVDGQPLEFVRPVIYRHVDRVYGELTRPVVIEPPVAVELPEKALVFPNSAAKKVTVQVKANAAEKSGTVRLHAPSGWKVEPESREFHLRDAGQEEGANFEVTPPANAGQGVMTADAKLGNETIALDTEVINYPHIPAQTLFPKAAMNLARADIQVLAKSIGYIMGAGDQVPEALRQIGTEVTLLSNDDLARGDLSRFDAIVVGVRAYNIRPELRANQDRLLEYVKNGGTMVVQYNVAEGGGPFGAGDPSILAHVGPYKLVVGHDRVTVEDAPVVLPHPDSPLLTKPNRIVPSDFEGWVQERGLYFASEWNPQYTPLFETHDPGEKPLLGGTLYTKYGKGAYVFTAFAWFRELPAGVPGAFRIFANLLSAGKTL
jgi:LmbE family N-acetylglucosaminyl deacetylase